MTDTATRAGTPTGPTLVEADLGADARGVFTGRGAGTPVIGTDGNVSHRRPHRPDDLHRARRRATAAVGADVADLVLMRQVHGRAVARVDATDAGHEVGPCDALTTTDPGVVLGVLTADCVPVLLHGPDRVAVAHAGRVGFVAGVVDAVADVFDRPGRAVIGPSIGGCCYEVPAAMRDEVGAVAAEAVATTTWGTPSLDLPAGVAASLRRRGWDVHDVGRCTHHDPGFHSHRRDPAAGRQVGLVRRVTP